MEIRKVAKITVGVNANKNTLRSLLRAKESERLKYPVEPTDSEIEKELALPAGVLAEIAACFMAENHSH